jgi:hypothetical protein
VDTALGTELFGWLVEEDHEQPAAPGNIFEKASLAVSDLAHRPRVNLLLPAFLLALALAVRARVKERRVVIFSVVTMAVQWAQMGIMANAGLGAHHTILLWPLPQVVIGISFAAASRRLGRAAIPALTSVLAVLMATGALQINEYYRMAWRNGGAVFWSNAVFRLSSYMEGVRAEHVYCMDVWVSEPLRVLNRGALPLKDIWIGNAPGQTGLSVATTDTYDTYKAVAADPQNLESPGMKLIVAAIRRPGNLFLGRTRGWAYVKDETAELLTLAGAAGYRREVLATIADSFGRPVYEAYRFVRN